MAGFDACHGGLAGAVRRRESERVAAVAELRRASDLLAAAVRSWLAAPSSSRARILESRLEAWDAARAAAAGPV